MCLSSCFSPRCDSFTRFDGSVRLHRGEPVSEGVHYSLLWFSVNERYLRQLKEDLRKELIACGFRPRRAGEWIVSLTKARRTRMRTL